MKTRYVSMSCSGDRPRCATSRCARRAWTRTPSSLRSIRRPGRTPTWRCRSGRSRKSAIRRRKSSALLQAQLKGAGFTVNAGVAEIPTAFIATWGSGKPVIGIVGEFDALPGLSQAATTRSPAARARGPGTRLRPSSVRDVVHGRGHCGQGLADREQAIRHASLLRHAGRRRRLGQGLHAPRRPVRRRRCRGDAGIPAIATRSSASSTLANVTGEVPLPRRLRARLVRARPRPLGARRRRGDEHDGEPDARARPLRHAHPLRDHQRRQSAERGPGLRGGLLLRAAQRHARPRRHLGAHRQRVERRGAGHRDDRWSSRSPAPCGTCCPTATWSA